MKYNVVYNFQGNNINFNGKFSGWWQCFTTSSWMLMSYLSSEIIGSDDTGLSYYLDDVEISIGKPGIGEKIKRRYNWIRGRTSLWWLVQKHGIEKWMWTRGIKGEAKFHDDNIPFDRLPDLIKQHGPVILQTNRMGGLRGGHIILCVGFDTTGIICHDPAGNALYSYAKQNGENVLYSYEFLKRYTGKNIRCIYWERL